MAHFLYGSASAGPFVRPVELGETPERSFLRRAAPFKGLHLCDASHLSLRTHERNPAANIQISFMGFIFSSTHFCGRGMEPVV